LAKPKPIKKREAEAVRAPSVCWLEQHATLAVAALVVLVTFAHLVYAATYALNPDEALHYNLAHQPSVLDAWRMNNTNAHPPFLILLLHFWRKIATAEWFLRLIPIVSGAGFVWFGFGWVRLVLGVTPALAFAVVSALIPPVYQHSQELRQYLPMMCGIGMALYYFERSFQDRAIRNMACSVAGLMLAVLSNYSAAWFAAGFGCYALVRLFRNSKRGAPLPQAARGVWAAGQLLALCTYGVLYVTHIAVIRTSEVAAGIQEGSLRRFYRLPQDSIADYLSFNIPGLFRYVFGSTLFAWAGAALVLAGAIALFRREHAASRDRLPVALLLIVPALLFVTVGTAGLYPFGGSRHSMLFALLFAIPMSAAFAWLARGRAKSAAGAALLFMLALRFAASPEVKTQPLETQRKEFFAEAVQYLKQSVPRGGLVFVDYQTSLLLCYYADPSRMCVDNRNEHFWEYDFGWMRVAVSREWSLHPNSFVEELRELKRIYQLPRGAEVWVIDGGWGEAIHRMLQVQFSGSTLPGLKEFGGWTGVFRVPN
jgi:hypothetical protein